MGQVFSRLDIRPIAAGQPRPQEKHSPMFSAPRLPNLLPENAAVHLRVRWQRGLLGVPMPTPQLVVEPRHQ